MGQPAHDGALMHPDLAAVEDTLWELFAALAPPPPYEGFLRQAMAHARQRVEQGTARLPLHLPLAIGEALGTPVAASHLVAAACLLVWLGADLFDNVVDDEVDPAWAETGTARLSLGAVTALTVLPHHLFERLGNHAIPLTTRHALSQTLSRALWQMSVGQFGDVGSAHEVRTVAEYEAILVGKSGAEVALFAESAARLAARPDAEVSQWHAFGQSLGILAQWLSDIVDLFSEPPGNDLRTGTRTAPILYTLHALDGTAREEFHLTLAAAQAGDEVAAQRARTIMQAAGALRYSLLRATLFHQQARQRLTALLPAGASRARLDGLLDSLSPLTRKEAGHER